MNDLVTTASPNAIQLPSDALALMQFCQQLSTARSIPPYLQKSPADCWLLVSICQRYGFDFLPVAWECSMIRNRLFFSGKMTAAMLNASGLLAEKLSYEYEGTGDDLVIIVSARLTGESERRTVRVNLKSVRTENENWKKNPEQQLAYAGARIWGRRHVPEVLLGLMFEGEVIDVTPNLAPPTAPTTLPPIAEPPVAEHEAPSRLDTPEDRDLWREWAQTFIAKVRASQTLLEVDQWLGFNDAALQDMQRDEPKMHKLLESAITQQQRKLRGGSEEDDAQ